MNKQEIEKAIKHLEKRNFWLKANPVCQRIQSRVDKQNYEIVRNELAISALTQQLNNGWIPCKDRLPTPEEYQRNDCRFIVTDGNRICEDIYDYMADGYIQPIWIYSKCQPIAWQNMPPRYKEVSE